MLFKRNDKVVLVESMCSEEICDKFKRVNPIGYGSIIGVRSDGQVEVINGPPGCTFIFQPNQITLYDDQLGVGSRVVPVRDDEYFWQHCGAYGYALITSIDAWNDKNEYILVTVKFQDDTTRQYYIKELNRYDIEVSCFACGKHPGHIVHCNGHHFQRKRKCGICGEELYELAVHSHESNVFETNRDIQFMYHSFDTEGGQTMQKTADSILNSELSEEQKLLAEVLTTDEMLNMNDVRVQKALLKTESFRKNLLDIIKKDKEEKTAKKLAGL